MSVQGKQKLVPIADCHMHFSSQQISDELNQKLPPEVLGGIKPEFCGADKILSLLDQAGILQAFVLSSGYTWGLDMLDVGPGEYEWVKFENDFTAAEVAKSPQRLTGFFSFNPLKDYAAEELVRCHEALKLPGLKLHFTNSDVDMQNAEHVARLKNVLSLAAERSIPALIHFRSRNPAFGTTDARIFIQEILQALPKLKVQLAHLGDWGAYVQVTRDIFETFIQAFAENPGLGKDRFWFDLSGALLIRPIAHLLPPSDEDLVMMADQIRRWGVERTLFGSDYFAFEPAEYAQVLRERLPLSEQELQTLFTNDGKALFER